MFFIVFQGNIRNHRLADADLKVFSCVLCAHSADVDGEGGDIRCPGRCFSEADIKCTGFAAMTPGRYFPSEFLTSTLEEARDKMYLEQYSIILTDISDHFHPVLVKISPALDESSQLQYLKKPRILDL